MTDASQVPTLQDLYDSQAAMDDIQSFTYNVVDSFFDAKGITRDTVTGRIKKMGYAVPIIYAGGISFAANDNVKTVEFDNFIYAPKPASLPFVTSGTFVGDDDDRFFVVQISTVNEISHKLITLVNKGTAIGALCGAIEPIGEDTIAIQAAGTGTILGGDSVQFNTGDETFYKVLAGLADISLGGNITIEPPLKVATVVATTVIPQSGSYQIIADDDATYLDIDSDGYTDTTSLSVYISDDLPPGFVCYVHKMYLNLIKILPLTGSGVTITSPKGNVNALIDKDSIVKVVRRGNVNIDLTGDLVETVDQDPQSGVSFTPDIHNANQKMSLTDPDPIACTIPPNADVPYPVGVLLFFKQGGPGVITFGPGAGVTLNSELGLKTTGQDAEVAFYQDSIDVWSAVGRLTT